MVLYLVFVYSQWYHTRVISRRAHTAIVLWLAFKGCLGQALSVLQINCASHGMSWCSGGTFIVGIAVCRLGIVPEFM